MSEKNKDTFLQGAATLGIAGVVGKLLGAIFRIPLVWIIGSVGLGYYQTAYPIYVMLVAIATSGFPVAISKMVSARLAIGDKQGADRVFWLVFKIMAAFGIIASAAIFFGADYLLTERFRNPKAYPALIALVPAILFVPLMASFRGYFQGHNDMRPSAISQVIEQLARVVFGIVLAIALAPKGLEYGAAGATFGATAGAITGLGVMLYLYIKRDKGGSSDGLAVEQLAFEPESTKHILKELLTIALPIIIGALVMPTMNMIDLALVMGRLEAAGFSNEVANSMYGQLTGMAATLINLPQVITSAIAVSLVPVISAAYAIGNREKLKHNTNLAIRVSLLIGLPAAVGLFVLSTPIIQLLYPNEPAASVGQLLAIMSIGVVFLSLIQSFTSVLQGMGRAHIPVINLFIGAGVKIVLTFVLTGISWLNVKGAAISTVSAYIVAATLDYISVRAFTNLKADFNLVILKPLITAGFMGICARGSYEIIMLALGFTGLSAFGQNAIATLSGVLIGGLVYVFTLFRIKAITIEELESMPKGQKMVNKLKKLKIIK